MNDRTDAKPALVEPSGGSALAPSTATYLLLQLLLPAESRLRLPVLGEVLLHPRLLGLEVASTWDVQIGSACEVFSIAHAGHIGHLYVEGGLAMRAVNMLLGLSPTIPAGALSRLERGLLVGALAVVLGGIGSELPVQIGEADGRGVGRDAFVIRTTVDVGGHCGQAWVVAEAGFFTGILAARALSRPALAPWIELAATALSVGAWADAEVGDRLVFDETPALQSSAVWHVQVRNGGAVAFGQCLERGWLVASDQVGGTAEARPVAATDNSRADQRLIQACLDCKVDRDRDRLALWARRDGTITLRSANEILGYGDRVEHDGKLAVLITRKLAG
jgi:hypothetical protein